MGADKSLPVLEMLLREPSELRPTERASPEAGGWLLWAGGAARKGSLGVGEAAFSAAATSARASEAAAEAAAAIATVAAGCSVRFVLPPGLGALLPGSLLTVAMRRTDASSDGAPGEERAEAEAEESPAVDGAWRRRRRRWRSSGPAPAELMRRGPCSRLPGTAEPATGAALGALVWRCSASSSGRSPSSRERRRRWRRPELLPLPLERTRRSSRPVLLLSPAPA